MQDSGDKISRQKITNGARTIADKRAYNPS